MAKMERKERKNLRAYLFIFLKDMLLFTFKERRNFEAKSAAKIFPMLYK
jgi:hypothetical protein